MNIRSKNIALLFSCVLLSISCVDKYLPDSLVTESEETVVPGCCQNKGNLLPCQYSKPKFEKVCAFENANDNKKQREKKSFFVLRV